MERKTGFEPATPTLARWCSTTELLPRVGLWFIYYLKQKSYLRQNPLGFVAKQIPCGTIQLAGLAGFEPTNDGVKVRCLTAWL
jgi:hypothetical protein